MSCARPSYSNGTVVIINRFIVGTVRNDPVDPGIQIVFVFRIRYLLARNASFLELHVCFWVKVIKSYV